ncbi:hypothetical protein FHL15_001547 [Xylaria flabelliformis]|uniref:Uncharacterized protein n=1 Tax=Xylaria flabelliformis TaxID=2512241 RepID=A0A553IC78_9PEZI|nr:hypothetical protein FHL15_001547 [Xylaria flabelliformis]
MKFLLLILPFLLGLVASSPTNYAELATVKNKFHEMGITDPVTFKLVDRLVELAAILPDSQPDTNNTVTDRALHGPEGAQLYAIPQGDINCHKDLQLDYMSVMAAAAQLGQQCTAGNMQSRDNWSGNDYWQTTRVYVCNWGGTNDCKLNQMLEAIAEIWNYCNAGTCAGWWRTYRWKKGYGMDGYDNTWCDWK